jgi:flagellin-like protein
MINYRKIRRNVKAISPVLSVLMMIAVAVAASLVTYAWVMGYLSFTTAKVGKAIQIQSIDSTGKVYIQNVGDSSVTLSALYQNGTQVVAPGFSTGASPLNAGATATAQLTTNSLASGDKVTVKVTTTDGTFIEMTKAFP